MLLVVTEANLSRGFLEMVEPDLHTSASRTWSCARVRGQDSNVATRQLEISRRSLSAAVCSVGQDEKTVSRTIAHTSLAHDGLERAMF